MGFADVWNRTLVYFGIAEEEDWDDELYEADDQLERSYAERPNVRRLGVRRRGQLEDWTDAEPEDTHAIRAGRPRAIQAVPAAAPVQVHLVVPRSFNDAQQIADKVFLLTPRNVEVSAEERARLLEHGGFFNQA